MKKDKQRKGKLSLLERSLEQEAQNVSGGGYVGRITNVITGAIGVRAFDTSVFAPKEQAERDKKILMKLQETDGDRYLNRENKYVMISAYEMRVVAALSYLISPQISEEDVKAIIMNPDKIKSVRRTFHLGELSEWVQQDRKQRSKKKIFNSLRELDALLQAFPIGDTVQLRPFFRIQSADIINETVTIDLGLVFFYNLDRNFSYLTPQVFIAWGKKGRQTELYGRLQFQLLNFVANRKKVFFATTKRLRDEIRYCKLTGDERKQFKQQKEAEIEQTKEEIMFYQIDAEEIKRKCGEKYNDRRTKGRFNTDFENAVEGYKEAGIILEGKLVKGKRGQQKAVFKLNLDYGTNLLPS